MIAVDTHCHVQDKAFDNDREAVIACALDDLGWIVVIGDTLDSSQAAVDLVRDRVYAAVGIHPHHAGDADAESLHALRTLAGQSGVVALGEIGLDYFYEHAPRTTQKKALEAQLALAADVGLPVVIHCRDAYEDITPILDAYHDTLAGGVMHCFSGDTAFVEQCLAWGFHISFAGNVTFPKAEPLRVAARAVPLDRLLVETDSPYLAPQPVRGKRCEPTHVLHTARLLSETKEVALVELLEATSRNAARLFRSGV